MWDVPDLLPVGAVEGAILDRFGDLARLDFLASFQVGHGARDAQNPVVGARRQAKARDRVFHLLFRFRIELAEAAQSPWSHLGIAIDSERLQTLALDKTRRKNPLPDRGRVLGFFVLSQLLVFYGGHLNMQVNAIEQRSGNSRQISLNQRGRARAFVQ